MRDLAKCENASTWAARLPNFRKFHKHNIFVFDKNLRIGRSPEDLIGTPIWVLEQARKNLKT